MEHVFTQRPWMKETCIQVTTMGHSSAYLWHPASGLKFGRDHTQPMRVGLLNCRLKFAHNNSVGAGASIGLLRKALSATMSSHQVVEHRTPDRNGAEHLHMMHTLLGAHRSWRIPTTSCCALARGQEKSASWTFYEGEAFGGFLLSVYFTRAMAQLVPSAMIPPRPSPPWCSHPSIV